MAGRFRHGVAIHWWSTLGAQPSGVPIGLPGWHSDDETLYGSNATIGSVSLGAARDFVMRNRSDHNRKITFSLGQGDILIMRGPPLQPCNLRRPLSLPACQSLPRSLIPFNRRRFGQPYPWSFPGKAAAASPSLAASKFRMQPPQAQLRRTGPTASPSAPSSRTAESTSHSGRSSDRSESSAVWRKMETIPEWAAERMPFPARSKRPSCC